MHRSFFVCLLLILLGGLFLATWRPASPAAAEGKIMKAAAEVYSQPETWNMGITVEGSPTYDAIIGRLVSNVGAFRSARSSEAATIFPAPGSARSIQSASFNLVSRTGSYSGTASLSLVIYDYAGVLQHNASADTDLQAAAVGVWTPIPLSTAPDDLVVSPGEFLAVRFSLSASPGGDLDVRPIFEVLVK